MGDTVAKRVDTTSKGAVDRRNFLKGAAAGAAGAASAIVAGAGSAQQSAPSGARPGVALPTEAAGRADYVPPEPSVGAQFVRHPASDYMVDVFKALDFDYVAVNPGSAFEGIHESIINHAGNRKPEILTVLHEEAGAAIAHGYAKAAGKPMMTLMHGTVGLLHASMGLFQAWCDRVPLFAVVGHNRNPTTAVNRPHSAQDMGALVRDFMKMDDEPTNLDVFANIAMRAYTIGRTPPMGPTLLVVDSGLQEEPVEDPSKLRVPRLTMPSIPQGDSAAVREAARLLVAAGLPVVARVVRLRRARLPAGRDSRPRAQRHDGLGSSRRGHRW
jgi:acetolactate synthase-1/2/3 large subunit